MHEVITHLIGKNKQVAFAATGGGSEAISDLLKFGGASSVVLDAQIPYSNNALDKYLGRAPDKYCSKETAGMMAATAYHNGIKFGGIPENVLGVGVCCALVRDSHDGSKPEVYPSGEPRKHRAFIAIHELNRTSIFSIEFGNYRRLRIDQEDCVVEAILTALISLDDNDEFFTHHWMFQDCDRGRVDRYSLKPYLGFDAKFDDKPCGLPIASEHYLGDFRCNLDGVLVFPGSFNPFHEGHRKICEYLYKKYNQKTVFEISIVNRDKPPVDYFSLSQRIQSLPISEEFFGGIYITNTAMFSDKIKVFKDNQFIVGSDTWNRIIEDGFNPELEDRFIVMPRPNCEINLQYYPTIEADFVGQDVSSTEIRKNLKNGQ